MSALSYSVDKHAPELNIDLDQLPQQPGQWSFLPGETITGCVRRRRPLMTTEATVKISLHGRIKTELVEIGDRFSSSSRTYHHGCVNFFGAAPDTQHVVYSGPVHVAQEDGAPQMWKFAITIPTSPMVRVGPDEASLQEHSFQSLTDADSIHHPLPGTYSLPGGLFLDASCKIEYYLTAAVTYLDRGKSVTKHVDHTIMVREPFAEPQGFFGATELTEKRVVHSHFLVPGAQDTKLSWKQKTRHFFRTSKVPKLHLSIDVSAPTDIQLGNPQHVPFTIRVRPDNLWTTPIVQDVPQTVILKYVKVELVTTVLIVTPKYQDYTGFYEDLALAPIFGHLQEPIVVPFGAGVEPLDVGKLINLTFSQDGARFFEGPVDPDVTMRPSWSTYTIEEKHSLRWTVCLTIADEEVRAQYEVPTNIYPLAATSADVKVAA